MTKSGLAVVVENIYGIAQYSILAAEYFGELAYYITHLIQNGLATADEVAGLDDADAIIQFILSKQPDLVNDADFIQCADEARKQFIYRSRWKEFTDSIAEYADPDFYDRYIGIRRFVFRREFADNVALMFASSIVGGAPLSIYGIDVVIDDNIENEWKVEFLDEVKTETK